MFLVSQNITMLEDNSCYFFFPLSSFLFYFFLNLLLLHFYLFSFLSLSPCLNLDSRFRNI
jgi:hypothetical protein